MGGVASIAGASSETEKCKLCWLISLATRLADKTLIWPKKISGGFRDKG